MKMKTAAVAGAAVLGLYVSQHMYAKALRARRGELDEASVVETQAGNLFFGQPNAVLGLAYYGALVVSTPGADAEGIDVARKVGAVSAALSSVYLGYSLLFKTRMPCVYCWTSHTLNVAIVATLFLAD